MKKLLITTILFPAIALGGTTVVTEDNYGNIRTNDNDTYNQPTANGGESNAFGGNSRSISRGGAGGESNSNSRAYGGRSYVGDTKSKAFGGDSSAYTGASTSNVDNVSTGSNNVNIEGDEGDKYNFRRIPANSAYAPSLITGNCLGSISVGGQAATFGISAGKTTLDKGCDRIRKANWWNSQGETLVAREIMLLDKDTAKAYAKVYGSDKSEVTVNLIKKDCRYPSKKCNLHRYRNR